MYPPLDCAVAVAVAEAELPSCSLSTQRDLLTHQGMDRHGCGVPSERQTHSHNCCCFLKVLIKRNLGHTSTETVSHCLAVHKSLPLDAVCTCQHKVVGHWFMCKNEKHAKHEPSANGMHGCSKFKFQPQARQVYDRVSLG